MKIRVRTRPDLELATHRRARVDITPTWQELDVDERTLAMLETDHVLEVERLDGSKPDGLHRMKESELRELGRTSGVAQYGSLRKADLIVALRKTRKGT